MLDSDAQLCLVSWRCPRFEICSNNGQANESKRKIKWKGWVPGKYIVEGLIRVVIENQMEKNMENQMETVCTLGFIGSKGLGA